MEGKAIKKIEGGKLVKVRVEYAETLDKVRITGDFFLHPEDALEEIEQSIVGLPANSDVSVFEGVIQKATADQKATFVGVSPKDIADTIYEALPHE